MTQIVTTRPNILFIMTDQQHAGALSCVGNKDLKTPAMDSLAANGTMFEKSFCSFPLCLPSRAAMFSGRMPHEVDVFTNCDKAQGFTTSPVLGKWFADAGYDCGYFGKWHLPADQKNTEKHGFESCQMADRMDDKIPAACASFLAARRDRPFFLVASFLNPHDICEWARGTMPVTGGPPAAELCPVLPDNFEIPADEPEVLREERIDDMVHPTGHWDEAKWRQYRWAYFRLIEKVDAQIGQILDSLRKAGCEKDTLVVFTSDHGDGAAAHRWNQKIVLYEESVRVPFIVSFQGVTRGGARDSGHLVSTGLDLFPTLCDYAGILVPEGLQGRSVRPLAEGNEAATWRDCVFAETTLRTAKVPGTNTSASGRMARTLRHKYIAYSAGERREQLFDMDQDPGEKVNLAGSDAHQAVLADLRKRLADWCVRTRDSFPDAP